MPTAQAQIRSFRFHIRERLRLNVGDDQRVREDPEEHFSNRAITELPGLKLIFDKKKQKEPDAFLKEGTGLSKQGDKNDRQQNQR